MASGIE